MKRWITAVMLTVATLATSAGMVAASPPAPAQAVTQYYWQRNYKHDWFYTIYGCRKWGSGAVYGNEVQRKIPGVVNYRCHRNYGELYWSIDLEWAGGSSSWAAPRTV